ncbi:MAG: phosphatidate cytidylyltransferase [Spirochaetia bacterium]
MNWKSFRSRLLLVGIAFPLLAVIILVVPHVHHMAVNLLAVGVSLLGGMEMAALFRARRIPTSSMLAPLLGASVPAGVFLEVAGALPAGWLGIWVPAALGVILVRAVLIRKDRNLAEVLSYSSSSFFTFLYPGFFLSWFVRLSSLPEPSLSILFFLCLVFGNDMAAYFAGSLWGASSRLNLPVSPQKSVVGFAGGLFGSLVVIGLFLLLTPGFPGFGLPLDIALGLCTGVTVILGDLLESGLKRSAGVKDSGIVIPARGGILDSVDSMILTAPLFYYFFTLVGG